MHHQLQHPIKLSIKINPGIFLIKKSPIIYVKYTKQWLHTKQSNPALANTFSAVGCHSIYPTLRLCPCKSINQSVKLQLNPTSGMYHNLIYNQ